MDKNENTPPRRSCNEEHPVDQTKGGPFRTVRVGLEPHLCYMGPVRVRVPLHIVPGGIREGGGLVASTGNAADAGKTPDRLIQLVRGEGPRINRDALPREDLAMPDGGDVGLILRTLCASGSRERGVHDQAPLDRRAGMLRDVDADWRGLGY